MTMTNIGALQWPYNDWGGDPVAGGARTENLDGTQQRLAWGFQAPKDGNIDSVEVRIVTITTNESIDLRIERPDSTGMPDGTAITNGTATIATPTAFAWNTFDFSTDPAVVGGEYYYFVLQWTSTQGDLLLQNTASRGGSSGQGFPHGLFHNGASWAAVDNTAAPRMRILYADGSYPFMYGMIDCADAATQANFGSGQTIKESGVRFRVPFRGRLVGLVGGYDTNSNTDLPPILFYEDSQAPGEGVQLLQIGDIGGGENDMESQASGSRWYFQFANPRVIERDVFYRVTFDPGATINQSWWSVVGSNGQMEQMMGTRDFYRTHTENDSDWIDNDAHLVAWSLVFDQIDIGQPLILNNNPLLRM